MENRKVVLQVGVKVLLKNKEGKYLLVRRNPKVYPEVGPKWDIVGGRINVGFTLIDNLKREVKEETGLELSIEPRLVAAQDILKVSGKHVVRLTFIGEIEGKPRLDDDHQEIKWFKGEEIKAMDISILDSYFRELLDKKVIVL